MTAIVLRLRSRVVSLGPNWLLDPGYAEQEALRKLDAADRLLKSDEKAGIKSKNSFTIENRKNKRICFLSPCYTRMLYSLYTGNGSKQWRKYASPKEEWDREEIESVTFNLSCIPELWILLRFSLVGDVYPTKQNLLAWIDILNLTNVLNYLPLPIRYLFSEIYGLIDVKSSFL